MSLLPHEYSTRFLPICKIYEIITLTITSNLDRILLIGRDRNGSFLREKMKCIRLLNESSNPSYGWGMAYIMA